MKKLILFSGGMDSTVALFHTLKKCTHADSVEGLAFNYGQRHVSELQAAHRVWEYARTQYDDKLGQLRFVNLGRATVPPFGALMKPEVPLDQYFPDGTNTCDMGIDNSFIPHRNLLFFVLAAQWALHLDCREIVSGIRGGFPDCSAEFESSVQQLLNASNPHDYIHLSSPVHISRAKSLELLWGIQGGWEALKHTLTCFQGKTPPCGECLPCTKRAEGFREFGRPDPIVTG